MSVPPSGEQFEIVCGDQRATIVEVGGGVREYRVGDRDVLHPYALNAVCDGAHGAPLIPWPNRLADGRYRFDGHEYQLALTEPEKQNAIHGLLRWRNWSLVARDPSRVVVSTRLHPTDRWPFTLQVSIEYRLDQAGLSVETRARNLGDGPAPYASGQHPYLSPGPGARVDECTLELRAATCILTDSDRQLPTGTEPVADTSYDFRTPRHVGSVEIDHAFIDLERDADDMAWVRLGCPDGRAVELWSDPAYPVTEIYTADTLAAGRQRAALGTEPMTAPPNALATGELIVRLEPGQEHAARWGVRLS